MTSSTAREDYRIGSNDPLLIEVCQLEELSVQNDDRVEVPKSGSKEVVDSIANTLRGFIYFALHTESAA